MSTERYLIIESVRERDIDLLILEELYARSGFDKLLFDSVNKQDINFIDAYRSVVFGGLGETDIEVHCRNNKSEGLFYILIENKIDADFQDKQYERYTKRADLIKSENINTAIVLIAPLSYIKNQNEFTYTLSYESILEWFDLQKSHRSWYKRELLRLAIEQERRGYQVKKDEAVTNFWMDYFNFIKDNLPDVSMPKPKAKPQTSSFVYFKSEWIPSGMRLIHKMEKGVLDLEITGKADQYENLFNKYKDTLGDEIDIVITNKSLCFRIETEHLSIKDSFDDQISCMRKMIDRYSILKKWYMSNLKETLSI